ncbi:hypothetical protein G6F57_014199 [Rhizopus arrhizus]|nr:hypothetical protein G6F57_014199 [Rhizopus arrhizus]
MNLDQIASDGSCLRTDRAALSAQGFSANYPFIASTQFQLGLGIPLSTSPSDLANQVGRDPGRSSTIKRQKERTMRGLLKPYAASVIALAGVWPAVGAAAADAAAQNKQCIDLAAAHQIVAGSRNARLYPDQALSQMKADKSFKFSETELKGVVNNVYFGGASASGQPMAVYQAVYDACRKGGPDPRWKPLQ